MYRTPRQKIRTLPIKIPLRNFGSKIRTTDRTNGIDRNQGEIQLFFGLHWQPTLIGYVLFGFDVGRSIIVEQNVTSG